MIGERRALVALLHGFIATAISLYCGVGLADPLDPRLVPEPLRPWTAWVLDGKQAARCPNFQGSLDVSRCVWPSQLSLNLTAQGGRFSARVHLDARAWVALPGDALRWPLSVKAGAKPCVVVEQNSVPSVELESGEHELSGSFAWDSLPDSLAIPPETGLVQLTLAGVRVKDPRRDDAGHLFLQNTPQDSEGERLEIFVQRRVSDEVPLLLTTRVVLNVSGKSRELVLGKVLPPGFLALSIDSELPARIEPDTRLRVQARPGTWAVEVTARSEGPVSELQRPAPEGPWAEGDEIWVFEAQSQLRLVSVLGARAVDPQQTLLPDAWKALPAYALGLADRMQLIEKRRGNADAEPDRLVLERNLWLDFDGAGFTSKDAISGTLQRATRLEMRPPSVLGRVAIDGKDQLITTLAPAGSPLGVEIRQGELHATADTRIVGSPRDIPALGYDHDFDQVSATLHIPPGYRLLFATGADEVPGTWLRHWTLLELFLVLVLSLSFAKLFGWRWGAAACVTFVLVFPETDGTRWWWAFALAAEALSRVIPAGKARALTRALQAGLLCALALSSLPFIVQHVREGLYPALATPNGIERSDSYLRKEGGEGSAALAPIAEELKDEAQAVSAQSPLMLGSRARASSSAPRAPDSQETQLRDVYDPNALTQTGPGLPNWHWSSTTLNFSGPVERDQRLHFYFLSPALNLVLALLRGLLLAVLFARLLPLGSRAWPGFGRPSAVAVLSALFVFVLAPAARAELPSDALLERLQERLLRKPACAPHCAASSRMLLELKADVLRARLAIEVSQTTAVPLPGAAAQWLPERVLVDGKEAQGLARGAEGGLWLRLEPGAHDVIVEGALPHREALQIALPLKPHHVEAQIAGWSLEGIHEDGLADDHLQLTRAHSEGTSGAALAAGSLPAFVRVERTLLIGLEWRVSTRVVRVTPLGTAVVLEVPLLRGESVTTPERRTQLGKVLVNMPPDAAEMSWQSVLEQTSPVSLLAPKTVAWTEVWRLDLSPIWHATVTGLNAVHGRPGERLPEFRPWPGESLTIALFRPRGSSGQTLTIDRSQYDLRPGQRATAASLTFDLRSSRGAEHVLQLPEGAVLESEQINGAAQPLRQRGRQVTLTVAPGAANVRLAFRLAHGVSTWFQAPAIDFGLNTVNATTSIRLSDSRWVLFAHGPRLGPAVLFWSLLLVLLLVAFALGRVRFVPLRPHEWMLLALGLSQIPLPAAAVVIAWLLVLGLRRSHPLQRPLWFDLGQLALIGWTLSALAILVYAVQQGLMGSPDMQIQGNGSSAQLLQWFEDRTGSTPEEPYVVSVPLLVYRLAMLAWGLWLALSLLRWLTWGWGSFASGGFWKRASKKGAESPVTPAPAAEESASSEVALSPGSPPDRL